MVLNSSEFNFYKLSTVSIYAINKSNFNESALQSINETEQDNYFTNISQVIPSHLELEGTYGTLNKDNQLEKVLVELEITSLNQPHLEIKKTQAKYFYTFGTTKIADFQDQNTTPTEPSSRGGTLWFSVLPLGALIAILLVLYYRKKEW